VYLSALDVHHAKIFGPLRSRKWHRTV
jgi:hypothetical protein